jgi:hypothetical protein
MTILATLLALNVLEMVILPKQTKRYQNYSRKPKMPWTDKVKQAQWQKDHPENSRRNGQKYRDTLKADMVNAYGGKCLHCGIDDIEVLVLDHIFDDAQEDRAKNNHSGGVHMYAKLRKLGWPKDKYQLLCHNCNYKKELNRRRSLRKPHYAVHRSAEQIVQGSGTQSRDS